MSRPNISIPTEFATNGTKTDFSASKISDGFDRLNPDVLAGDNLNKFIDDTYKGLNGVLELYEGAVLYDASITYSDSSIVFDIDSNDKVRLYHSLINSNTGNALTDTTKWEELIIDGVNKDLSNLSVTGQAVIDGKVDKAGSNSISANNQFTGDNTFTGNLVLSKTTTLAKENNDTEGGQIRFERADNDTLTADPYIDLYDGYLRVVAQVGGTNRVWQIKMKDMSGGTIVPQVNASASGYVVYGDGFKIQWGNAEMSSGTKTVAFSIPFTTTGYQVFANGHVQSGTSQALVNCGARQTTWCAFYSNTSNLSFGWMAVGY